MNRAAAFLDRDGVINEDYGYVHRWADFVFLPGVSQALHRLQERGYLLVIVTNQSGIGRGYFSTENFDLLTEQMITALRTDGIAIAGVYHCPHDPDSTDVSCSCRKPLPGMIEQAIADLSIDRSCSFLVGDKPSDIEAGKAARLSAVYQVGPRRNAKNATAHFTDLPDCVEAIFNGTAGLVPPSGSIGSDIL